MNKNEVREILNSLNTEEEIADFVKERLSFLEENSEEKMLGQNYEENFRDYISSKAHFKPGDSFSNTECADLVYDDIEPYIELMKSLKNDDGLKNNLEALVAIYSTINNYLPLPLDNYESGINRATLYISSDRVSIKEIKKEQCAECSERAGLAQNMFKVLGMDSELVAGYIKDELHAYNFFYPKGYDNEPVLLYDTSNNIDFVREDGKKISFPMFKALTIEEKESLLSGESTELDLKRSEQDCKNVYPTSTKGYEMVSENPIYTFGIEHNSIVR